MSSNWDNFDDYLSKEFEQQGVIASPLKKFIYTEPIANWSREEKIRVVKKLASRIHKKHKRIYRVNTVSGIKNWNSMSLQVTVTFYAAPLNK